MKKILSVSAMLMVVWSMNSCQSVNMEKGLPSEQKPVSRADFELVPDKKADYLIGWADSMTKIFREIGASQYNFGRLFSLSIAGRERESFQLL